MYLLTTWSQSSFSLLWTEHYGGDSDTPGHGLALSEGHLVASERREWVAPGHRGAPRTPTSLAVHASCAEARLGAMTQG